MAGSVQLSAVRALRIRTAAVAVTAVGAVTFTAVPATAQAAGPARSHAPSVERVSVAADGTEADNNSTHASLSRNGAFTVFHSAATNLTSEPTPRPPGAVHVRDNTTGTVTRIRDSLQDPAVSDDGRYVTYLGWGSQTVKVKLTDLETGQTRTVSSGPAKAGSNSATMSADGRYIAFTQLPNHPSVPSRVDVYDRVTDTYETVSEGPPVSTRDMQEPSISADGRYVAYRDAGTGEVWRYDRDQHARVRVDDSGSSELVQLGGNGRTVAINTTDGAYVRDVLNGATTRLPGKRIDALSQNGHQVLYRSNDPVAYSALRLRHVPSGRETDVHGTARAVPGAIAGEDRLVFDSPDAGIVPGDTNGKADIFLWRAHPPQNGR
ncbi:protein TolB [Streptomyces sp. AN091965]|uniref:protein TolB n=1 Tax=Streptomyces sp. AN091965 TaxID=2927803 RepID=UPI001F621C0B|nr:protein TolB [Streptomyces sp. AN091965]MCI3935410.1 protein TolB [Streptomyces sp. AN091965]